jgi:hypothetical protein
MRKQEPVSMMAPKLNETNASKPSAVDAKVKTY